MTIASKLTLYDFLSMFVTGVLFLLIIMPDETYLSVSYCKCRQPEFAFLIPLIYSICAYVIGLIWHKFIEWITGRKSFVNLSQYLSNVLHSFCRCDSTLIKSSKENVAQKFSENSISNNSVDSTVKEYFAAYYRLMKHNALGSVPVLEAQEAFVRDIILPLFIIGLLQSCGRWAEIPNFQSPWIGGVIMFVSIIILPIVHYALQRKICELIWEGNEFITNKTYKAK